LNKLNVLVDTSVWSEALRRKKNNISSENTFIYHLIKNEEEILLTGSIIQEILTGIKNTKLFEEIEYHLNFFHYLELEKKEYSEAARLRNQCAQKGVAVTTIDCQIVIVAINRNIYLATYDSDFQLIAKHTKLKVLDFEDYKNMKR
jgi:predicted nucleic acid-binding protein